MIQLTGSRGQKFLTILECGQIPQSISLWFYVRLPIEGPRVTQKLEEAVGVLEMFC